MFFFFFSILLSNDLYRNVRSKERKLITIKKEMTENLDNIPTIDEIELEIIKYSNILLKEEKLLELWDLRLKLLIDVENFCQPVNHKEKMGFYDVNNFSLSQLHLRSQRSYIHQDDDKLICVSDHLVSSSTTSPDDDNGNNCSSSYHNNNSNNNNNINNFNNNATTATAINDNNNDCNDDNKIGDKSNDNIHANSTSHLFDEKLIRSVGCFLGTTGSSRGQENCNSTSKYRNHGISNRNQKIKNIESKNDEKILVDDRNKIENSQPSSKNCNHNYSNNDGENIMENCSMHHHDIRTYSRCATDDYSHFDRINDVNFNHKINAESYAKNENCLSFNITSKNINNRCDDNDNNNDIDDNNNNDSSDDKNIHSSEDQYQIKLCEIENLLINDSSLRAALLPIKGKEHILIQRPKRIPLSSFSQPSSPSSTAPSVLSIPSTFSPSSPSSSSVSPSQTLPSFRLFSPLKNMRNGQNGRIQNSVNDILTSINDPLIVSGDSRPQRATDEFYQNMVSWTVLEVNPFSP